MSIINEALKKAGQEKGQHDVSEDQQKHMRNLELEGTPKKKEINWGPVFVLLVLLLITGPVIAPIFSSPFRQVAFSNNSTISSTQETPSSNRKSQFVIEETPVFHAPPAPVMSLQTPSLALSGLVYSKEGSYCIINDTVVKVGDAVQGAKLTKISANEVTFDYQGKTITLALTR